MLLSATSVSKQPKDNFDFFGGHRHIVLPQDGHDVGFEFASVALSGHECS
jgi:hypothetical protein